MQKTLDDPSLRAEPMYIKLRARLEAFFINVERVRKLGMTDSQKNVINASGFPMTYRIQLYKCLR